MVDRYAVADNAPLLSVVEAYGRAKEDCGYFSDGSQEQTIAADAAERLLKRISLHLLVSGR